jgi:hypothetical protein
MIGILFFGIAFLLSLVAMRLRITALHVVVVCVMIYSLIEYVTNPEPGTMPIYLLLILATLVTTTIGIMRR